MPGLNEHDQIDSLQRRVRELEATVRSLVSKEPTAGDQAGTADVQDKAREAQLRAVFDRTLDAMVIADDHGRLLDCNRAACDLLSAGRERLIGRRVADLPVPGFGACTEWSSFLRTGKAQGEFPVLRPDGQQRDVEFSATANIMPGRHLSVLRDVTERKRMEQLLGKRGRMETLGKLAGGLANDFNNLLSVILGYGQFALEGLPEDASIREELRQVLHAGERATVLTRQLLALSRSTQATPSAIDLGAELRRAQRVLRPLLGDEIVISVEPNQELWPVSIDVDQLEQILLNLACNAHDAMPNGGELVLSAHNAELELPADDDLAAASDYVVLCVRDTGIGMSREVKQRIFEPLFTTKLDHAAGMGLAATLCLVRNAGGHVSVDSTEGAGTTFQIHLPRAATEATATADAAEAEPLRGGNETVLLVEDEPAVLKLAQRVLASHGYNVLRARNGTEALSVSDAHPGPIRLLLTDLIMPQMGGEALAKHFLERRPDARVLYMTGYSPQMNDIADRPTWLQKPLRAAELLVAVRAVLDG